MTSRHPPDPGPHRLTTTRAVLGPAGDITCKDDSPNFFAELAAEFGTFAGHALIATFEFDADWPSWEKHPKGDELVYLLFGDIDFVLWIDGTERIVRLAEPGTYLVVPKGTWHTGRPRKRSALLFVTPGEDTVNAEHPQ